MPEIESKAEKPVPSSGDKKVEKKIAHKSSSSVSVDTHASSPSVQFRIKNEKYVYRHGLKVKDRWGVVPKGKTIMLTEGGSYMAVGGADGLHLDDENKARWEGMSLELTEWLKSNFDNEELSEEFEKFTVWIY